MIWIAVNLPLNQLHQEKCASVEMHDHDPMDNDWAANDNWYGEEPQLDSEAIIKQSIKANFR